MPTISVADYFSPNLFFVTSQAVNREPVLRAAPHVHLLRTVLNGAKQRHPFRTAGYVLLPEHVHLLIEPEAGVTLDGIMDAVITQFSADYLMLLGQPDGVAVWQTSYRARKVQNEADFAVCLDYVHYDPVRHGLVARPEEWLHSSYEVWVERGLYELGWGWTEPNRIRGKNWG